MGMMRVSDRVLLLVAFYMLGAFAFGVLVGQSIRWGETGTLYDDEEEEDR